MRRRPNSPSQSSDFAELRRCDDETRHWIVLHVAGYEMRVPDVKASKRHFKKDPVIPGSIRIPMSDISDKMKSHLSASS